MRIAVDVMSGDNAPEELIHGALDAAREFYAEITLCGDEGIIRYIAVHNGWDLSVVAIRHAPQVIVMEDPALSVMKEKKDSSMAIGLQMLASGEADAFVSAGNTGALLAGATLIVRRIKGIRRAAIGTVLPFSTPVLLMDSGANIEVSARDLLQFGVMGSIYMQKLLGIEKPRVGLLNNGTEYNKGTIVTREAYQLLSEGRVHFAGNIEGRAIPFDSCDVLVTDGFTGNVLLKYTEGMGALVIELMTEMFKANPATMMSGLMMKKKLKALKHTFSSSEYGGAPLLGISRPVIKAHGSSKAADIRGAIRQAINYSATGVIRDIARYLAEEEKE